MRASHIFVAALSVSFICVALTDDEEKPEERDPWDKSTDRYHHDNAGDNDLRVDVTETSESEVHTERKSKLRGEITNVEKQYGKVIQSQKKIAQRKKKKKNRKVEKSKKKPKIVKVSKGELRGEPKVDVETKQQFDDAMDEKDPIDDMKANEEARAFTSTAQKKAFNYWADFYPGSLWEYPYPYFHPQYHCNQQIDCPCAANPMAVEAKVDESDSLLTGVPIKKPKKAKKKQLIPSHYYGPPSAGWGSFEPGKTGCGWGTPYWYKKRHNIHKKKKHSARQLVPSHYYGPPSAGWGSFDPGKTGCGWGTPYWYKKRHHVTSKKKMHSERQLVPSHYYGPPSAGWGSFEPGKTGCGWGTPYWYKSQVPLKPKSERAARKFYVQGMDPENLGHTGYGGWDSGLGRGRGATAWGAPNRYGWGPYAWHRGGKNNLDFMAWFGPNSFGTSGWGGQGWVSNYGMMYNGKPLGMPNEATGFGNIGSDVSRIDETIGQGDFAATASNLMKGNRQKLLQSAANPDLAVTDNNKIAVGINGNEKIRHLQTENVVEQGVAKRIQTPDVSSEDGASDNLTSDVLQVSSDSDTSDGKSEENLTNQMADMSEKQSENDQGIAEVVKDSNGETKVSNIDEQLPENAETSTASPGQSTQDLPGPGTVDLTSLAEGNSKVSSKEKEKLLDDTKSSSENKAKFSAETMTKERPSNDKSLSEVEEKISKLASPSKSESSKVESPISAKSESEKESSKKIESTKTSKEVGELQTIKTPTEDISKASSPAEAAAQQEMKAKVDQLIKQAKNLDKGKEEKQEEEKKMKEEEALRKQEEAYSTIKSKAANTVESMKAKAKVKTELFTSKRQPQMLPKLKTVKTEAANEKPLTI